MTDQDPVRQVDDRVWRVVNQIHPSNSYICATGEPGACFLVDPGTDAEVIDLALGRLGLEPRHIFCTHGHFDHVGSASFFQEKYGASCHLHGADLKTMRGSNFLLMAFKVPFSMRLPKVDEAEGFTLALGDHDLRVIPAPGHTPGSCLFQYGHALFTGDTLYAHGVGLSRLPGGDPGKLKATLLALWDRLPDEALVFPGHGDCAPFANIRRDNLPLLAFLGLVDVPERER
jgi:glyoxylase-like metal-dependent hydrolase (beta-lactamase superfamily II)